MEELEGIKELVIEFIKDKKETKIAELENYLNLNHEIVWKAINSLCDEGKVFLPSDSSVRLV